MNGWIAFNFPEEALDDPDLPDYELRTLLKICRMAWDKDPSHPPGETKPAHWREFVECLAIPKSTYFRHLKMLRAVGYLRIKEVGNRTILVPTIPTFRNAGPTTTLKDSISLKRDDLSSSSRSHIPTRGNGEVHELLLRAGIGDPLRSELASDPEISPDYLQKHIGYAKSRRDPRQLLAFRLKNRDPAPDFCTECGGADGQHALDCPRMRGRYLEGQYADFLKGQEE